MVSVLDSLDSAITTTGLYVAELFNGREKVKVFCLFHEISDKVSTENFHCQKAIYDSGQIAFVNKASDADMVFVVLIHDKAVDWMDKAHTMFVQAKTLLKPICMYSGFFYTDTSRTEIKRGCKHIREDPLFKGAVHQVFHYSRHDILLVDCEETKKGQKRLARMITEFYTPPKKETEEEIEE